MFWKCHYVVDEVAGRVLIPGCWGSAVYGEGNCHCPKAGQNESEEVVQLKKEIKELKKQISILNKKNQ